MKYFFLFLFFAPLSIGAQSFKSFNTEMQWVKDIPLPAGYERVPLTPGSFAEYLRKLPLRKDKTIYLYNGRPKEIQWLHYAVIDLSTGNKDLQQCADVIMRLRAEYFYEKKMFDSIRFPHSPQSYRFTDVSGQCATHECLMRFMEKVFMNCGTYTLDQQMKHVSVFNDMRVGDVLLKAGAPGHAEIIADMAINPKTGKKIYLLAEGYMPAQDIHILLNPLDASLGPWYEMKDQPQVLTASWLFTNKQLRRW